MTSPEQSAAPSGHPLDLQEIVCRSCDSEFPLTATDIGEIKLVDIATREPSGELGYWPLCHSHMMMALIAGWNPVKIDTPEGQKRIAAMKSPAQSTPTPVEQSAAPADERLTVKTLGDDLPVQMARVRDVLIPQYQSIGPAGAFGIAMMRSALDRAAKAMAEGDLVEMIRAYQELKEFKS